MCEIQFSPVNFRFIVQVPLVLLRNGRNFEFRRFLTNSVDRASQPIPMVGFSTVWNVRAGSTIPNVTRPHKLIGSSRIKMWLKVSVVLVKRPRFSWKKHMFRESKFYSEHGIFWWNGPCSFDWGTFPLKKSVHVYVCMSDPHDDRAQGTISPHVWTSYPTYLLVLCLYSKYVWMYGYCSTRLKKIDT